MSEKSKGAVLHRIAPFGLRHEIAKRYPAHDWLRSRKIARAISPQTSEFEIKKLIDSKNPGLVGRLGGTEARFLGEYLKIEKFQKVGVSFALAAKLYPRWKKRASEIHLLSGFYFNNSDDVKRFTKLYLDALSDTDILGAWGVAFTWVETLKFNPSSMKVIPVGFTAPSVEPYVAGEKPWSFALSGKKVLVISGFSESIASQHKRINSVFNKNEYPDFDLMTIKAPLVSGVRDQQGKTWFQLLDEMKSEMSNLDFDVALIAAGAFSYPLAAYAKKLGKVGIHCGGGLQLFFGIMGNRWNKSPEVLDLMNEFWVRPSANERPKTADSIEDACYW
jgi:hypothetical protein